MAISASVEQFGVPIYFSGDLSAARSTPWIDCGHRSLGAIELHWPAGVLGTLALFQSNACEDAVTGTPYEVDIPDEDQPDGSAGSIGLFNIELGMQYFRIAFTPGVGNDGIGKYLTGPNGGTMFIALKG